MATRKKTKWKWTPARRAHMERLNKQRWGKKRLRSGKKGKGRSTEFPLSAIPDIRKPPKPAKPVVVSNGALRELETLLEENRHLRALLRIYLGRQA